MRALRSRKVQSDSGSNISDTDKEVKKRKRNKKSKNSLKKNRSTDSSLQSQSTDVETLTKSKSKKTSKRKPEISNDTSIQSTKSPETTKSKKAHKNEEFNNTKTKRVTRRSMHFTKEELKENISPNNKNIFETDVFEKSPKNPRKIKQKNRKNERHTSEESIEFKNVVTSTAIKPKKKRNSHTRDSSKISEESENRTRLSRNLSSKASETVPQKFDVTETKNESKNSSNKRRSSGGSTFEVTRNSQEYSPAFKNIVTSTTIKPKKPKHHIKKERKSKNDSKEAMEIDDNDSVSSNNLLKTDIINISDGIPTNTINNQKNVTDVLNSTYSKIDECPPILTTNNSGQWEIEKQKSVINISDETKMFESNLNNEVFTSPVDNKETKKVLFQEEILNKSARKKWARFQRNSQGANLILEQISTPQKKSLPSKSLNISQKLNKTGNTTEKSANKIKRTAMPNFALIHKKAYEKMESIADYSQRKKDRANLLLSNKKVESKENNTTATENKIKSSRQLFSNEKPPDSSKTKFNRFGFKVKSPLAKTNKPQVKPLNSLKPSIYERNEIMAIANKKPKNTGNVRENKRDMLKGVRTNRRFELLMKMRNN